MRTLTFDSGPIISLTMNNLLWVLEPLKKRFNGSFIIPDSVYYELVERPLKIKKYEYEAIQVSKVIEDGVLDVVTSNKSKRDNLLKFANSSFVCKGNPMRIIQDAEMDVVAISDEVAVIDERTVRLLIEDPEDLRTLLEKRLHANVQLNKNSIKEFKKLVDVKVIRSSEIVSSAYSLGLFKDMVPRLKNGKQVLLDALLWGLKSNGCAITESEIEEIKNQYR